MSVVEFASAAELRRHYFETRNRLRGQKPRLRIVPPVEPEPAPITEVQAKPELPPISPITPQSDVILSEEPEVVVRPTLRQLLTETAVKHGFSLNELISHSRHKRLVHARQEFFYRATMETLHSYPMIGRHCGDRDHTTVMYGVQRYCDRESLTLPRGAKFKYLDNIVEKKRIAYHLRKADGK